MQVKNMQLASGIILFNGLNLYNLNNPVWLYLCRTSNPAVLSN